MNILANIKPTDPVRPFFNVGGGFDIPTGYYVTGKYGDSILCGGVPHITGICGPGNSFKSTLSHFFKLRVLERYLPAIACDYDTEGTVNLERIKSLAEENAPTLLARGGFDDPNRYVLTNVEMYDGGEFFDTMKEALNERLKSGKKIETPFLDPRTKQPINIFPPALVNVDSFSLFQTKNVLKMQDENEIGDSGQNMIFMRDGVAKTQMLSELPALTSRTGAQFFLTAHLGQQHSLDPRQPPEKKLAFLKADKKIKGVTEKFLFVTNNLWMCDKVQPLINDTTKAPEFPRNSEDDMKGDTDLVMIRVTNLRPKSGAAGIPMEVIASQSEGILPSMTEFWNIKRINKDYGIEGNVRNYALNILPEVSLSRTTVRGKINDNPHLRRALEITNEMCQYFNIHPDIDKDLFCTPKQLYDDLKAKGYEWDMILKTRGYWTFDHYSTKHEQMPLTTLDLLNMRAGLYSPWWLKDKPKVSPNAGTKVAEIKETATPDEKEAV